MTISFCVSVHFLMSLTRLVFPPLEHYISINAKYVSAFVMALPGTRRPGTADHCTYRQRRSPLRYHSRIRYRATRTHRQTTYSAMAAGTGIETNRATVACTARLHAPAGPHIDSTSPVRTATYPPYPSPHKFSPWKTDFVLGLDILFLGCRGCSGCGWGVRLSTKPKPRSFSRSSANPSLHLQCNAMQNPR